MDAFKITTPAVKTYTYIARLTDNSLESILSFNICGNLISIVSFNMLAKCLKWHIFKSALVNFQRKLSLEF